MMFIRKQTGILKLLDIIHSDIHDTVPSRCQARKMTTGKKGILDLLSITGYRWLQWWSYTWYNQTYKHSLTSRIWRYVVVAMKYVQRRALIANPPNSPQLEGTPYHSPKLHPGPRSSVGMWWGTDRLTDGRDQYTFRLSYVSHEM